MRIELFANPYAVKLCAPGQALQNCFHGKANAWKTVGQGAGTATPFTRSGFPLFRSDLPASPDGADARGGVFSPHMRQDDLTCWRDHQSPGTQSTKELTMGRGILLWLIGIPIPIIILLVLFLR
ncbi:hypothetical protein [Ancylobacter lacus]|uniref:hypothetical protein n=1 Tax=Ancylobacter lacus TaxID=2579970 RepID=UPI001BCD6837|nr:hypothetical protein [Ancylobacter lacus]MBS7539568.1 hypothetical protein [Ancylobacter lacus]